MKKFLLSLLALAGFVTVQAQVDNEVSTATLIHGENTTVFQGANGLISAYDAAADTLDVIVLSPGSFNPPANIQKSITIRGAGFEGDSTHNITRTRLSGNVNIVPGEGKNVNGIRIEGIRCQNIYVQGSRTTPVEQQAHDLIFNNCYVENEIRFYSPVHDATISQSYVFGLVHGNHSDYSDYCNIDNLQIFNSNLGGLDRFLNSADALSYIFVNHSIIRRANTHYNCSVGAYIYYNCIVNGNVPSGSTAHGCILIGQSGLNNNVDGENNYFGKQISDILVDGSNSLDYIVNGAPHSLAVKDEFLGVDGTPVGVFGGILPWNPIPGQPRIIDFKTTVSEDNKTLHISIQGDVPSNP